MWHVWTGESASRVITRVLIDGVVATPKVKRSTRPEQSPAKSRNGRRSIVYLGRKNATAKRILLCETRRSCAFHSSEGVLCPYPTVHPTTHPLRVRLTRCPPKTTAPGRWRRDGAMCFDIKISITRRPVNSGLVLYRVRCQIKNH